MNKKRTFTILIFMVSAIFLYFFYFENFPIMSVRLILTLLTAIIPTVIFLAIFTMIKEKKFKREISKFVINTSNQKPKMMDNIVLVFFIIIFFVSGLLVLRYPLLLGLAFIFLGLYSLVFGRGYWVGSEGGLIFYHTGLSARIFGFIKMIMGVILSYSLWKILNIP